MKEKNRIINNLKKANILVRKSNDKRLLEAIHPYAIDDAIEYIKNLSTE